jgi:hypothetical protein
MRYAMGLRNNTDIPVLKERNDVYIIVYDPLQKEYYNVRTDIFLTDDDISYHKLRPYDKITSPLPDPLPSDYFTKWDTDNG